MIRALGIATSGVLYVRVIERSTWGHVGVFDVVRIADGVTMKTFADRVAAEAFAAQVNAVARL